jgi:hypothetical protein
MIGGRIVIEGGVVVIRIKTDFKMSVVNGVARFVNK